MNRIDDWQTKLAEFLDKAESKSFDFPTWNCAIFVADAVKVQIRRDLLKGIRGKFENEIGASKQLRRIFNVNTVQELFRQKLDTPLKPVAFARVGDIVFAGDAAPFDLPIDIKMFGPVPGICYGQQSYFLGENKLIKVETLSLGSTLWVS
jgi:hypothetical protein